MVCSLDEKESVRTSFWFLLFPFILVNQVVGLCQSIDDLCSDLHKEARTLQWPWVALTDSYCGDSDYARLSENGTTSHFCANLNISADWFTGE